MKKTTFAFLVAIFCSCFYYNADAQLQKGNVILGLSSKMSNPINYYYGGTTQANNSAGIQFATTKTESTWEDEVYEDKMSTFSFNLNPSLGVMVSDHLMLGLSGGLSFTNMKNDGSSDSFTAYSFTPTIRYYFNIPGKFIPYCEARGGLFGIMVDGDSESQAIFGGKVGGAIFINNAVALDLYFDYDHMGDKEEDEYSNYKWRQGTFGLGIGFSIFL